MPEEIVIPLDIDNSAALEKIKEVQQAAADAFERQMTRSIEKAQKQLKELTTQQEVHNSVIENTKAKINDLERAKSGADAAALSRIKSEQDALRKLTEARTLDIQSIEAKKAKIEGSAIAMLASNDAERKSLEEGTKQRIISIQSLRDQDSAYNKIRDTVSKSTSELKTSLDEINKRQQLNRDQLNNDEKLLDGLNNKRKSANDIHKQTIDSQIAATEKVINGRRDENILLEQKKMKLEEQQALLRASSEEEVRQIKSIYENEQRLIQAQMDRMKIARGTKDAWTEATEKYEKSLETLNMKQGENNAIIAANAARIKELKAVRETASESERGNIDKELAALERATAARTKENLVIEQKKVKLIEVYDLENAGSATEKAQIIAATEARIAELEVMKAQVVVQNEVTEAVDRTGGAIKSMFSMFTGASAAIFALQTIKKLIEESKAIMDGIVAAGNKLRDLTTDQFDVGKSFANEMGWYTPQGRADANAVINTAVGQYHVDQETTGGAAADIAQVLTQEGIDPKSQQGIDLIGTTALFKDKGLNTSAAKFFIQKQIEDAKKAGKNLSGNDLNQSLSNLLADSKNSPELANEFLEIQSQNYAKFEAAGIAPQMQQMFSSLAQTVPAQEVGKLMSQYVQGTDRLLGLHKKDAVDIFLKMNGLDPSKNEQLKMIVDRKNQTPAQTLKHLEQFRNNQIKEGKIEGVPEMDAVLDGLATNDKVDVQEYQQTLLGLGGKSLGTALAQLNGIDDLTAQAKFADINKRMQAARAVAGPRNVVAAGSMPYDPAVRHDDAPLMPIPSSGPEMAKINKQLVDAGAALKSPVDPGSAEFQQAVDRDKEYVARNADQLMTFGQSHPLFGTPWAYMSTGATNADPDELSSVRVILTKFMTLARMPRTPATTKAMKDILSLLRTSDNGRTLFNRNWDALEALANGSTTLYKDGEESGTLTDQQVLSGIANDAEFVQAQTQEIIPDVTSIDSAVKDDRKAGPVFNEADDAIRAATQLQGPPTPSKPTTQPTTKPTTQPVSINYHVLQTNYGYDYASIGSPESMPGRLS